MMKQRLVFWVFAALGAAPAAFATDTLKLPLPDVEKLSNGIELVWFTSDKLPVIDVTMILRSGTRDDLPGKSGTAELMAASLDRGAGGLTAQQLAQKVEALGASRSAGADSDFMRLGFHGLAPDADTFLDLMAKMVLQPEFPAAEVKREQSRMLDGWSRVAEYGSNLADLAFRRAVAGGTSYARGELLSAHELEKISRADVVAFHRRNFTPKNAVLVVVGRVDRAAFRSQINTLFGGWKGEAPRHELRNYWPSFVAPTRGEVLLVDRPGLTQAQVRIGMKAPRVQDSRHYALVVGNALLGEYFHSRLNTLIRDQLGLTYGIGSSFSYDLDLATFGISSATRNESVGQVIRKTLEVLNDLKRTPIPTEEVEMAKEYLVGGFPLSTATLESVASRWITTRLFGLGPERLNEYIPKVSAVTAGEVSQAMGRVIDPAQFTMVVAGDAKELEPVLKKAKFKVRKISAHQLLD